MFPFRCYVNEISFCFAVFRLFRPVSAVPKHFLYAPLRPFSEGLCGDGGGIHPAFLITKGDDIAFFRRIGHRADALRRDPRVSFCVYDGGYRNDGEWALNIRSVIVFGTVEVVEDAERIAHATAMLSRKFTDDEAYLEKELASAFPRVNCLELAIEHMTGKLVNES